MIPAQASPPLRGAASTVRCIAPPRHREALRLDAVNRLDALSRKAERKGAFAACVGAERLKQDRRARFARAERIRPESVGSGGARLRTERDYASRMPSRRLRPSRRFCVSPARSCPSRQRTESPFAPYRRTSYSGLGDGVGLGGTPTEKSVTPFHRLGSVSLGGSFQAKTLGLLDLSNEPFGNPATLRS